MNPGKVLRRTSRSGGWATERWSAAVLLLAPGRLRPAPGPAPPAAQRRRRPAAAPAVARPGAGPRIALSPDNVHIEYRVLGHGEPAVLLVHGWACDANYWNEQLEALKAHYTVVAINLAGHGGSGSNRSDWSIANYAPDVAAVAKQIPNQHLVLVGHAMGATVVLAAAPAGRRPRHRHHRRRGAALGGPAGAHRRATSSSAWRRSAPTSSARRATGHHVAVPPRTPTTCWCRRSPTTCRSSRRRSRCRACRHCWRWTLRRSCRPFTCRSTPSTRTWCPPMRRASARRSPTSASTCSDTATFPCSRPRSASTRCLLQDLAAIAARAAH